MDPHCVLLAARLGQAHGAGRLDVVLSGGVLFNFSILMGICESMGSGAMGTCAAEQTPALCTVTSAPVERRAIMAITCTS